eukprot:515406_1
MTTLKEEMQLIVNDNKTKEIQENNIEEQKTEDYMHDDMHNEIDESDEITNMFSTNLRVGIRLRIEQLSDINTVTQTYCARIVQVTDWLACATDLENYKNDKENYNPQRIAKVLWLNATEDNIAYEVFDLIKAHDGNMYNVRLLYCSCVFTEGFECENFPFDVQDLSFVADTDKDVRDVIFVPSRINIDMFYLNKTYLAMCDWEVVHVDVTLQYIDWYKLKTGKKTTLKTMTIRSLDVNDLNVGRELHVTSAMIFRVQVKRRSFAFCVRVLFWMFLLSLMGFYIFGFEYNNLSDRLSFSIGLIFAIIAFQFIIGDQLPNLPYLTIVDKYNLA